MRSKIGKLLRFFELFGIHFEESPTTKVDLFFVRVSRVVWIFYILLFIFLLLFFIIFTNYFWRYEVLLIIVFYFALHVSIILALIFLYKNRKKEKKCYLNLSEAQELIEDFLDTKIDWKKFVRTELLKIFIQQMILTGIVVFRYKVQTEVYEFKSHYIMPDLSVIMARTLMFKYVFYVNLMHCMMKVKGKII